jgi:iron complex outermembrane receptor protein
MGLAGSILGQEAAGGKLAPPKAEAVLFDSMPVVEAASLHTQTLVEAPASVTVITDEDIWRRGYRTLAEALADVRGMYVSYDRAYQFVGVRGFSMPGDYNTRFLVMIDGHSLSENVYGSAGYFGQDFGLDLDLIKRIEIIRGPSSALYGSNGMFATINIVTKSPVEYEQFRAVAETDSFGERKVGVSFSQHLGRGANLLVSASAFNSTGQSLYFPEFDTPETNHGRAVDMDGEKGYHTFANLIWHNWSLLAYFNDREKQVPTAWYGATFNGRGTKVNDGRGFLESAYERDLGADAKLRWRIFYDQYRYQGRYDYLSGAETVDQRDGADGDWVGTELTYRFRVSHFGYLTAGTEASLDLRSLQVYYQRSPVPENLMHIDRKNRSAAVFVQQEMELSRRWKLYLGGRLDEDRLHGLSLSPRVALVYQPSQSTALKLLYGRSFREPNSFEQFYDDGTSQIPNPALLPERMHTFEVAFERRLRKRIQLSVNAYRYQLDNLIAAVPITDTIQQYKNVALASSTGIGPEAQGQLGSRLKIDASMALQKSDLGSNSALAVNCPTRVGKLLLDTPLLGDRLSLSGALQYLSERGTLAGATVPSVYLVNVTVASRRALPGGLEIQAGIRNLFDRRSWDPAAVGESMDRIEQDGRSFFVRLSWAPPREKGPDRKSRAALQGSNEQP